MQGYTLIDGRNIAFASLGNNTLSVGDLKVEAIFKFLRTIRAITVEYPSLQPIVLWDGRSWRYKVYPEYKGNRKKTHTESGKKAEKVREELAAQIPFIMGALKHLGVVQMIADNYEADDLAGYMVERHKDKKIFLISADRDWAQLVSKKVTYYDPIRKLVVTPKTIEDLLGVSSGLQLLELKILKGDTSDNIPGVGGIGEKGALEFLQTYGSVKQFIDSYVPPDKKSKEKLPKKFTDLATVPDKMKAYRRNKRLMDLRHPKIPEPKNLRTMKGNLDRSRFKQFCKKLKFKSILSEFDDWMNPFE